MFDYLFQILYYYYERREKGGDSVWTASFYVSVIQFLLFYSIVNFVDIFSNGMVSIRNLNVNRNILKVAFLGVGFVFYAINLKKYRKKCNDVITKYKNNPSKNWFRIWMFMVLMAILFFSPVLWALLHKAICL